MKKIKFIDLFAGAGGLSEGFIREGFSPVAHVEMDCNASNTLKTRTAFHYLKSIGKQAEYNSYLKGLITREQLWAAVPSSIIDSVINEEISEKTINNIFEKIDSALGKEKVDVIIGGPPCQAYSIAGRSRDPKGMKEDSRNFLYKYYVSFLKRYSPKLFVFENVPGILSARDKDGVRHLDNIKKAINDIGYDLQIPVTKFLNARNFGVLQDRKRVIIIGWKKNLKLQYPVFTEEVSSAAILPDLFSDLCKLNNGEGSNGITYYCSAASQYLKVSKIRTSDEFTTQHISRPNNNNDLEIYKIVLHLWDKQKRLNYSDLPAHLITHSNTDSFKDRFRVVDGNGVSHTIVAHIAKDGHYYIHPDPLQLRSITVREAARIQSFPDDYFFEGSRSSAFRQIGNAVPVLMAEGIAKKIKEML